MTKIIKVSTGSVFEQKASYSRAVAVDDWIYVSLTAGRNPQTKIIPEDICEQTRQVFINIEAALRTVDATLNDVIFSRVFIQDPQDVPAALDIIGGKYSGIDPATTICCAPLASPDYKIEIEVTAFRGASQAAIQRITLPAQ